MLLLWSYSLLYSICLFVIFVVIVAFNTTVVEKVFNNKFGYSSWWRHGQIIWFYTNSNAEICPKQCYTSEVWPEFWAKWCNTHTWKYIILLRFQPPSSLLLKSWRSLYFTFILQFTLVIHIVNDNHEWSMQQKRVIPTMSKSILYFWARIW